MSQAVQLDSPFSSEPPMDKDERLAALETEIIDHERGVAGVERERRTRPEDELVAR